MVHIDKVLIRLSALAAAVILICPGCGETGPGTAGEKPPVVEDITLSTETGSMTEESTATAAEGETDSEFTENRGKEDGTETGPPDPGSQGPSETVKETASVKETGDHEDTDMNGDKLKEYPVADEVAAGSELMCLCDTKEEAESVASQYGISLERFEYGVATFHTAEDPVAVIERGRAAGLKPLELNRVIRVDDPVYTPVEEHIIRN